MSLQSLSLSDGDFDDGIMEAWGCTFTHLGNVLGDTREPDCGGHLWNILPGNAS